MMYPTQSVVPAFIILNLIRTSGPVSLSNSFMVIFMTTAPSSGTFAPPATPHNACCFFQYSKRLTGCSLLPSWIPAFLCSFKSQTSPSSVMEFTPDPPSNMTSTSRIPALTSVWYWIPESSLSANVQQVAGSSSRDLSPPLTGCKPGLPLFPALYCCLTIRVVSWALALALALPLGFGAGASS